MFSVSKNTSTAVKPTVRLYNKSYRQLINFFSEVAFISSCSYIFKKFSWYKINVWTIKWNFWWYIRTSHHEYFILDILWKRRNMKIWMLPSEIISPNCVLTENFWLDFFKCEKLASQSVKWIISIFAAMRSTVQRRRQVPGIPNREFNKWPPHYNNLPRWFSSLFPHYLLLERK